MATQLKLRARSVEGYFQDYTFDLNVLSLIPDYDVSTPFRFRIEIEGIDVTQRLLKPGIVIQSNLDFIRINEFTVGDCNIPLKQF